MTRTADCGAAGHVGGTAPGSSFVFSGLAVSTKSDADTGPLITPAPLKATEVIDAVVAHNVSILTKRLAKRAAPVSSEYPIAALGPLADACQVISEYGQLPPALVAQCLLSAAAVTTQSVANVQGLAGAKPLSIYTLTTAASGEGKSAAEGTALRAIRDHQRRSAKAFRNMTSETAANSGSKTPEVPPEPYVLVRDATIEGLRQSFVRGRPSQGIFTAEGGTWLGGYGMSAEQKTKTAATLNELWDGDGLSVTRAQSGRIELHDRRLSMNVLIQPEIAQTALNDPTLVGIGLWPRFLFECPPESRPRRAFPFHPETHGAIRAYWDRCTEILSRPIGEDCADLDVLQLTDKALQVLKEFFERVEVLAKSSGGAFECIRPFAMRSTEQVVRVAGVLTAFAGDNAVEESTVRQAITIVLHSLDNWRAVFGDRGNGEEHSHALKLYAWLLRQRDRTSRIDSILRIGPKALRSKDRRDTALAVLIQDGAVVIDDQRSAVRAHVLKG